MAVDSSIYDVAQIPFPAITICSNNKIVERQLESVLLTQPWKSLAKKDPEFTNDFKKALTAIVMARENPPMLDNMNDGTVSLLNKYQESLPQVLKKVSLVFTGIESDICLAPAAELCRFSVTYLFYLTHKTGNFQLRF